MGGKLSWMSWPDDPQTVITPARENTSMLAANVANYLAYLKYRVLLLSDPVVTLDFDFGEDRDVQVVAMQFPRSVTPGMLYSKMPPNIGPTDTIQFLLSSTDAHDGDVYDSGAVASGVLKQFSTWAKWLPQAYTAQYLRIVVTATSRLTTIPSVYPVAFLDIKRVWAGPAFIPRVGFNYGINRKANSNAVIQKPQRGTTMFPSSKEPVRETSFVFGFIKESTEAPIYEDFEMYINTQGEYLFHRDDLADGRGDMFCFNGSVYGLTDDNFGYCSKSVYAIENI